MKIAMLIDKGGRRSGIERRVFSYAVHLPDQRSGKNRRRDNDHRSGVDRRSPKRSNGDRRKTFFNCNSERIFNLNCLAL